MGQVALHLHKHTRRHPPPPLPHRRQLHNHRSAWPAATREPRISTAGWRRERESEKRERARGKGPREGPRTSPHGLPLPALPFARSPRRLGKNCDPSEDSKSLKGTRCCRIPRGGAADWRAWRTEAAAAAARGQSMPRSRWCWPSAWSCRAGLLVGQQPRVALSAVEPYSRWGAGGKEIRLAHGRIAAIRDWDGQSMLEDTPAGLCLLADLVVPGFVDIHNHGLGGTHELLLSWSQPGWWV